MSMYQSLRVKAAEALKKGDDVEKNILRTVIGEVERQTGGTCGKEVPDSDVRQVIKKFINNNFEVITACDKQIAATAVGCGDPAVQSFDAHRRKAGNENMILFALIPDTMTAKEVEETLQSLKEGLRACKNDGQAIGMANKTLKGLGKDYFGDDVANIVKGLRA